MFVNYKKNRKKYKGFTLIELLSILLILFIIFSIVVFSFKDVFNDVNTIISSVDENMILTAANDYALEYRGSEGWVEGVDGNGNVNFCVSLQSLIDYGYFKNDKSNFEEIKDKYVVEFKIINGVSEYRFIKMEDLDLYSYCKHNDFNSSIQGGKIENSLPDSKGNSVGNFDYEIKQINNRKYSFDFDLSMDLVSVINDVYVTLILDRSGSMRSEVISGVTRYDRASEAAINFSQGFLNLNSSNINANVSLIFFDYIANKGTNGFVKEPFNKSIFDSNKPKNGMTNIGAGIDMAISLMCHSGLDIDPSDSQWCTNISDVPIDNTNPKKIYTILFFDGDMNAVPNINNSSYGDLNALNTYNDVNKRQTYYKDFLNVPHVATFFDESQGEEYYNDYVQYSIKYLKEDLDVNLFLIGYDFSTNATYLKKSVSYGDNLCKESDYSYGGKKYCYYDAKSSTIENVLGIILENIEKDAGIGSVEFNLSSKKNNKGENYITILNYDDSNVKNNRLEIKLEGENLNKSLKGYKFVLNDSVFDNCDSNKCEINQELFDFSLLLEYKNGEKKTINVTSPKINLSFEEYKTIN